MAKKLKFTFATGKRREAAARVRLFKGKGENVVNDKPLEKYFPGEVSKASWMKPFLLTQTYEKYYISAKVAGGGPNGQLGALVHGIARVLSKENPEKFRSPLKKAGLLTRDARTRLRRMIGMGGKSRRKKQSPKR